MAIQTVFLAENTTAYATDVMNLVDPLYTDLDGSNVSDKTGTGTTLVLSASPAFTGTVTLASITASGDILAAGNLTVGGNSIFGDVSDDTLTINAATASIPNGLNFGAGVLFLDETNNLVRVGKATQTLSDGGNYAFNVYSGTSSRGLNVEGDIDGATGILINTYQNSATPAASDLVGGTIYKGNNSSIAQKTYASIYGVISSATAGAEYGGLDFRTIKNGADTSVVTFDATTSLWDFKTGNSATFDNNTLYVDAPNNFVYVGANTSQSVDSHDHKFQIYTTSVYTQSITSENTSVDGVRVDVERVDSNGGAPGNNVYDLRCFGGSTVGAVKISTGMQYGRIVNEMVENAQSPGLGTTGKWTIITKHSGADKSYLILDGDNDRVEMRSDLYFNTDNTYDIGTSGRALQAMYSHAFTVISDETVKENISPIPSALPLIKKLTPITFNYLGDKKQSFGFGARAVLKEAKKLKFGECLVSKPKNKNDKYGLNDQHFPALLVKGLQELEARLSKLEKGNKCS